MNVVYVMYGRGREGTWEGEFKGAHHFVPRIDILTISREIALKWIPQDSVDDN